MYFTCPYLARLSKDIAAIIKDPPDEDMAQLMDADDATKLRLHALADYQTDLIKEPCANERDKKDAIDVLEEIAACARKEFDNAEEAEEKFRMQLLKLMHPGRFLMKNGEASWGHSGSVVVAVGAGAESNPVGMLLCGYPDPSRVEKGFRARHFRVLQGLKLSATDLNYIDS